jgi:flagellar hook-associated protein 1 FlgK
MSNLLASLLSSTTALQAYDRVLNVTQNNVSNASTPGYAKQRLYLSAMAFDQTSGSAGGIRAGDVQSMRSQYAEQAVRRQTFGLGEADQLVASLTAIESLYDISGDKGIPRALNRLFQSFSEWGVNPNSSVSRSNVIERASDLARSFNQAADDLSGIVRDTEQQIRETVDKINNLARQVRDANDLIRQGARNDAGLDARMHAALEELAEYVDFTALRQADGSMTILLGAEKALVTGDRDYPIRADFILPSDPPPTYPSAPATAHITAADGTEATGRISSGRLGALLDVRNRVLPGLVGNAYQPGELNRMAKTFADHVNQILTGGRISDGPPPVAGLPLFEYDATNDAAVARTLKVAEGFQPGDLAAIDPGPPYSSNGIPLHLSSLAAPTDSADRIDGFSFTQFYASLASAVGGELAEARTDQTVRVSLVAQAKDIRQQVQGVSLDEEATILIEFQRGYQANARVIKVLDDLTLEAINLVR